MRELSRIWLRRAMKHEISGGYSGSDATPLGLMEFLVRCPGVVFTALHTCPPVALAKEEPRAEIRNPVGVVDYTAAARIKIQRLYPSTGAQRR